MELAALVISIGALLLAAIVAVVAWRRTSWIKRQLEIQKMQIEAQRRQLDAAESQARRVEDEYEATRLQRYNEDAESIGRALDSIDALFESPDPLQFVMNSHDDLATGHLSKIPVTSELYSWSQQCQQLFWDVIRYDEVNEKVDPLILDVHRQALAALRRQHGIALAVAEMDRKRLLHDKWAAKSKALNRAIADDQFERIG